MSAEERFGHTPALRDQANLDPVTGLYNRRFMQTYLQRLLAIAARRRRSVALLVLQAAHAPAAPGDFLTTVAGQLRLMTDKVGIVGRLSGDQFAVVLPDHSFAEARALAQAFDDCLIAADGSSLSWGIAVFPDDGLARGPLLTAARKRLAGACRAHAPRSRNGDGSSAAAVLGLLERLVSSIDRRDHYTRAHCENTAAYCLALARVLRLDQQRCRTLRLAALLHDVGKIGIPDDILRKPGPLTPDEFAIVKHHVNIAGHLIVGIPCAAEVRDIALHHHERWDGSGYPDGLKGEAIPYLARLLAVADAFAAVTMDRPHSPSLSPRAAYAELRRVAGSQLDPQLVVAFGAVVEGLLRDRPALRLALAPEPGLEPA